MVNLTRVKKPSRSLVDPENNGGSFMTSIEYQEELPVGFVFEFNPPYYRWDWDSEIWGLILPVCYKYLVITLISNVLGYSLNLSYNNFIHKYLFNINS